LVLTLKASWKETRRESASCKVAGGGRQKIGASPVSAKNLKEKDPERKCKTSFPLPDPRKKKKRKRKRKKRTMCMRDQRFHQSCKISRKPFKEKKKRVRR